MKLFPRLCSLLLLVLAGGCASSPPLAPAPEYLDRLVLPFTRGVPEEQPLPPLRTQGLSDDEQRTVRVYRNYSRAVVNITSISVYRTPLGRAVPDGGNGSGFIIDQSGSVVTNHHVVQGAQRLIITLYDGSLYPAEVVGSDPELDLAVVRFDPQGRQLTTIPPGDSSRLQVGQRVLALGNPFGLEGTLTSGVISALDRPLTMRSGFIIRDLIQTDAAINPGNSGGPLLNSSGELIGVNSMMVSPSAGSSGIGLAIPANTVQRIVTQLLQQGRVERGWIDIEALELDRQLAAALGAGTRHGVLVVRVLPGGNAEQAKLQDGRDGRHVRHGPYRVPAQADVITHLNGERIVSIAGLLAALEASRPGQSVRLTVLRAGVPIEIELVLGERPR